VDLLAVVLPDLWLPRFLKELQMKTGLTATLLVCVGAVGVAVGALALDAGGEADSDDADSTEQPDPAQETGGYGSDDASGGDGAAQDVTLTISDFDFSPVTAAPGATVAVENRDDFPHTVTAEDGSFDTGNIDATGSGSFVAPSDPGTYDIRCNVHPQMSGTVTVG
jgi:plastocyanin